LRITSPSPVTLVGGAKVSPAQIDEALRFAPKLVAADGGANALLAQGLRPDAVFGDMDSISKAAKSAFGAVLHPVTEQDSTDFDKALRHIDAPLTLALGVSGGRLDHELAGLHVLMAHPDRPCLFLGVESLAFVCPPSIRLNLPLGMVLSLFPLASVQVMSDGLRWPTGHLTLDPLGRIGTSNEVVGDVWLQVAQPHVLVILPLSALAAVVTAFEAPPARWPARAQ